MSTSGITKKDGLTIMQLVRATPPYIKENAKPVIIKSLKKTKTKGGHLAYKAVAIDNSQHNPRPHKLYIIAKDKKTDTMFVKGNKVLVSCTCEFFTFTCEYALTYWGASRIVFSNGEPAHTTNPGNQPTCCKHLIALIKELKAKGM